MSIQDMLKPNEPIDDLKSQLASALHTYNARKEQQFSQKPNILDKMEQEFGKDWDIPQESEVTDERNSN